MDTYFQDVAEFAGRDEFSAIKDMLMQLRRQKEAYEQDYYRTGRLVRDMSLTKLLTCQPEVAEEALAEGMRAGLIEADGQKFCALVAIERIGASTFPLADQETRSLISFSVMNVCEEMGVEQEEFTALIPLVIHNDIVLSGIVAPGFDAGTVIYSYAEQVRTFFLEQLDVTLSVCVSGYSETAVDNPKLLEMAYKTLEHNQALGIEDAVLFYDDIKLAKSEKAEYSELISQALRYIDENYQDTRLTVSMLADEFHVTLPYISTIFKQQTGNGPLEYIHSCRIEAAVTLLSTTDKTIKEISEMVGYTNPVTMARAFRKIHGVNPQAFRYGLSPS